MTQEFVTLRREVVEQALEAWVRGCPPDCKDGMTDSGGTHPWGEAALIQCPACQAVEALRAALEQPQGEQKPRAWLHIDRLGVEYAFTNEPPPILKAKCQPLYTHSQNLNCKSNQARLATLWGYVKEQPQREPLTHQQIDKINRSTAWPAGSLATLGDRQWLELFWYAARAIEAAHNIK